MSDWLEDVMLANLKYREGRDDHDRGDVDVDGMEEKSIGMMTKDHGRGYEGEYPHDKDDYLPTYDPRIAC